MGGTKQGCSRDPPVGQWEGRRAPREGGHPKPASLVLRPLPHTDVWDCVKSAACWACLVHPSPPVSFCCQEFGACNSLPYLAA